MKCNKIHFQILEHIKKNIIHGNLKSGVRLPSEEEWAKQLGASRVSIHEVICSLEMLGLVICKQGEGNFIGKCFEDTLKQPLSFMFFLGNSRISEILELRRALEIQVVKLASRNMTVDRYERLEEICTCIEIETNELLCVNLDKSFHKEIAIISKNNMIENILKSSRDLLESSILDTYNRNCWDTKRVFTINQDHSEILSALQKGDSIESAKVMSRHMDLFECFLNDIETST